LQLQKAYDCKNEGFFDSIVGKHGDYRACRRWQNAVKYIMKDGNYLAEGFEPEAILNALKSKKSSLYEEIAIRMQQGATVKDICSTNPGFVLKELKNLQNFEAFISTTNLEPPVKTFYGCEYSKVLRMYELHNNLIAEWLNKNLLVPDRPHKQQQLWIAGPPNIGKTHLLNSLRQYCNVYIVPYDNNWYDDYTDDYDIAVMDEFVGQKTINFLNQFLEGAQMKLNRRNIFPYVKKKNIPVIIMSNFTPKECFHNKELQCLDALLTRLLVVEVPNMDDETVAWVNKESKIDIKFSEPPKNTLIDLTNELEDSPTMTELFCGEKLQTYSQISEEPKVKIEKSPELIPIKKKPWRESVTELLVESEDSESIETGWIKSKRDLEKLSSPQRKELKEKSQTNVSSQQPVPPKKRKTKK